MTGRTTPSHFQTSADSFPAPKDRTHTDLGLAWIIEQNFETIPAHPYEDDSRQVSGVMHQPCAASFMPIQPKLE